MFKPVRLEKPMSQKSTLRYMGRTKGSADPYFSGSAAFALVYWHEPLPPAVPGFRRQPPIFKMMFYAGTAENGRWCPIGDVHYLGRVASRRRPPTLTQPHNPSTLG